MTFIRLASRLYGTPLLIARPKLDVILSVLGSRIGLHHPNRPDLDMALRQCVQPDVVHAGHQLYNER